MEIEENKKQFSLSQSQLEFNDGSDTVGAVSVGNSGVRFRGVVTEQKHFLGVEGVFGPSDVRQQTRGRGTLRVVGVPMVDEVDWYNPRQSPGSYKMDEGRTNCIHTEVIVCDTVHLRDVTTMNRPKVEHLLVALPH